jgi:UDP-glucose 4-epimerase
MIPTLSSSLQARAAPLRAETCGTATAPLHAYRDKVVLVTGASGFVGRWVCRLLTASGARVHAVARDANVMRPVMDAYDIKAELLLEDLAKTGRFAEVHRAVRPAITFNLVGYGVDPQERDSDLMAYINAELAGEIAGSIATGFADQAWSGARLVHVGSGFEYGSIRGPIVEDREPNPTTPYGRTKLEGTRRVQSVCESTGLSAVTARVFTVYGPGEHPHRLLPSLRRAARDGTTVELTAGQQERDFTYIEDVAYGLLRLGVLRPAPGQLINLATGRLSSVESFVRAAQEVLALRDDQVGFGSLPYRNAEVWQGTVDVGRLRELLDWSPPFALRRGIQATHEFLLAHGGAAT